MTFGKWSKLYQAYKDDFDVEMYLRETKKRYCDIERETTIDDVIPF